MAIGYRSGIPIGAVNLRLDDDVVATRARLSQLTDIEAPRSLPVISASDLPGISVIVPTIAHRRDDLVELCESLTAVDYPTMEIVLVDNRSTIPADDFLSQIAADYPQIRLVREPVPGISAARNTGLRAAKHDIVVFTDDDVRVDPGWLRAIGTRFAHDVAVEVVTGLILPAELETPAQIWLEQFYGGFGGERSFTPATLHALPNLPHLLRGSRLVVEDQDGEIIKTFAIYGVGAYAAGANMGFRREALERIGGFDVALGTGTPTRGGEDLATIISILWTGGRMAFEPAAFVHHRHRRTLKELEKQLFGNGVGWSAYMTSLILKDPRHLLSVASQIPRVAQLVVRDEVARRMARPERGIPAPPIQDAPQAETGEDSHPSSLDRQELRGLPRGPIAYLRTRRRYRRLYPQAAHPMISTVGKRYGERVTEEQHKQSQDLPLPAVIALTGVFAIASVAGRALNLFSSRRRRT